MPLTARRLNRATLARQLLLRRESLGVPEAVRRVVALQAQEPASPYLALWNRIAGFDAAELDRAFLAQAVVKSTAMRVTLHAMTAEDGPPFRAAMQPTLRAARLGDDRFLVGGLTREQADEVVADLLAHAATPRSNQEMEAFLDERFGELPKGSVWWAIRTYAPFVHAPNGSTWMFGPRPAYVAASLGEPAGDPELALRHLLRRYLEGFGPASVADVGQFAMVTRARVRAAAEAMGEELVRVEGPKGQALLDVPGGVIPDEATPAPPRLLGMWDEMLFAYDDRSRVIPEAWRKAVIRTNGDTLPTVLVDGLVAGVWRPAEGGGIEVTAFTTLAKADWAGLEAEAASLVAFLAPRDPAVYRRYSRWWAKLPPGEVRILAR
jgi:hypothetical protein